MIDVLLFFIILINLVLLLIKRIFKLKYSPVLQCGIWGFSLKPGGNKKASLQKFKILGLYNKSRGRDASGVFVNGDIIKGIGLVSEFDDFIEKNIIPTPKDNCVMLGHARQGSVGYKKTIDEAHPFLINNNLVFTHNGTIRNIEELCNKYRKDKDAFTVDSQALGVIIDEDGYAVLDEYKGAAALAFTRINEPNTLYLYHGASRDFSEGKLSEERPLFFMENKDGIFYSSMEESLKAIMDSDSDEVNQLEHNNIFKIENGKFILDQTRYVDRENANVYVYEKPVHVGKSRATSMTSSGNGDFGANFTGNRSEVAVTDLVRCETLPIRLVKSEDKSGFIYYHYSRFWEAPRKLMHGPAYIKKGGWLGKSSDNISKLEFFWRGILIKDKNSYESIKSLDSCEHGSNFIKNPGAYNYAMHMSNFSKYPITNIGLEALNCAQFRDQWYKNGSTCKTDNFTPAYSNGRNYKIEGGYLIKISCSQKEIPLWANNKLSSEEVKELIESHSIDKSTKSFIENIPYKSKNSELSIKNPILSLPFIDNKQEDILEKENDELLVWYDVPFITKEHGMKEIGNLELETLREYISIVYLNEFGIKALDKEIDTGVSDILNLAEEQKFTILDAITNDMDKQLLISCYDDILERERRREHVRKSFNSLEDLDIINKQMEDEMTKEEILDRVESAINIIEDASNSALELWDLQDDDMSQECAKVLFIAVPAILVQFEAILSKYGETDLVKRIKKIREDKTMTDGVL